MPRIVDRASWGARAPQGVVRIATPTPRLWVHHTASEQHGPAGVRAIQAYHMGSKGWRDIAYSFLVDDDGTIFEGRGAGVAGGHTQGDNSRSHAICLLGDFEKRLPTKDAVDSLVWLARHGAQLDWWYPTLGGHRDAAGAQTACPGRHVYALLGDIRNAVATGGQFQEDDMPLTSDDLDQIANKVRFVLNEGTGGGQTTWAGTSKATLATGQAAINLLNVIKGAVAALDGVEVDEAAIAAAVVPAVLAGLSPAELAAAIAEHLDAPDAEAVANELAARLAS